MHPASTSQCSRCPSAGDVADGKLHCYCSELSPLFVAPTQRERIGGRAQGLAISRWDPRSELPYDQKQKCCKPMPTNFQSSRLYFLFSPFWLNIFYFCCQAWLCPEELRKFTSAPTLTILSLSLHHLCQPARSPVHVSGSQSSPGGHG